MVDDAALQSRIQELEARLSEEQAKNRELSSRLAQFTANILELTVQSTTLPGVYRLKADWNRPGDPVSAERNFQLAESELLEAALDPVAYGFVLGKALFAENIRDLFTLSLAADAPVRVLLAVEVPELQVWRWERLAGPFDGENWRSLLPNLRTPFSLYVPTTTERRFPPLQEDQLKVLVVVASPSPGHRLVSPFSKELAIGAVRAGLGTLPRDILAHVEDPEVVGPPNVAELCQRLSTGSYTALHLVCHGAKRRNSDDTVIFLDADPSLPGEVERDGRTGAVPTELLIRRLSELDQGIPHFAFLSVCDSGVQEATASQPAGDWRQALRGLAQRLVRDLGIKSVVAMTDKISQTTALGLSRAFYPALLRHGEADVALADACIAIRQAPDLTTPALYSRLAGRRLFNAASSDTPVTPQEISALRTRIPEWLRERAPVLLESEWPAIDAALHSGKPEGQAGLERLCEEVLEVPLATLARDGRLPRYQAECPFPGLRAFTGSQRKFFRGRDALVTSLVERLRLQSVVCVFGNSGSGKSSVVAAGVIPTLQDKNRALKVVRFTPGSSPEAQLDQALVEVQGAEEAIVYVDQFEELFTLCPDAAQRGRFLDRLLEKARPELRVILTMRADFLGECATHAGLRRAAQRQPELVAPMTPEELRAAIEAQAQQAGLRYESGLLEDILVELVREPGAMPLLQHALAELWNRRHGRWLRRAAWRLEIGGVAGALEKTAEEVWNQLSPEEQAWMPRLMTGLARVGTQGAADTRRRASLKSLLPAGAGATERDRLRGLVTRLAGEGARLLVTSREEQSGEERVEVAHEALLRHWPRLRRWLDEAREMLLLREDLRNSAQAWVNARKQGVDWLEHRGARGEMVRGMQAKGGLELEEDLLHCSTDPEVTGTVAEYVAVCEATDKAEADKKAEEERRLRGAILAAATRRRIAARDWVGAAGLLAETLDPASVRGYASLALEVLQHPLPQRLMHHDAPVVTADWQGNGVVTGSADGVIHLWPEDGSPGTPVVSNLPLSRLRVHPDGSLRAVTTPTGFMVSDARGDLLTTFIATDLAWSPDGATLLVVPFVRDGLLVEAFDGVCLLVPTTRLREALAPGGPIPFDPTEDARKPTSETNFSCGAFSPDSSAVVLGRSPHLGESLLSFHSEEVTTVDLGYQEGIRAVFWGDGVVVAATQRRLIWVGSDLLVRGSLDLSEWMLNPLDTVRAVLMMGDGRVTLVATSGGLVLALRSHAEMPWTETEDKPELIGRLEFPVEVGELRLRADGQSLLTVCRDGTVGVWSVDEGVENFRPPFPRILQLTGEGDVVWFRDGQRGVVLQDGFLNEIQDIPGESVLASGSPVVASPDERHLLVIDRATSALGLQAVNPLGPCTPLGGIEGVEWPAGTVFRTTAAFSPSGEQIAIRTPDGRAGLWNPDGGVIWLSGIRGRVDLPLFSPDGRYLALLADGEVMHDAPWWVFSAKAVQIWDLWTGAPPLHLADPLVGRHRSVTAVRFSPNSSRIAGSLGNDLLLWDLENGKILQTFPHPTMITGFAFCPDGQRIATATDDGIVRVWGAEGPPQVLAGHTQALNFLVWSDDGQSLYGGGYHEDVVCWSLETSEIQLRLRPGFFVADLRLEGDFLIAVEAWWNRCARWPVRGDLRAALKEVPPISEAQRHRWLG